MECHGREYSETAGNSIAAMAAQAQIATLRSIYGSNPDEIDRPVLKDYCETADALATVMRTSIILLEELIRLHDLLPKFGHVSLNWLNSQKTYAEGLIDKVNEASIK